MIEVITTMTDNVQDILNEREKTHGSFEVHALVTQDLKSTVQGLFDLSGPNGAPRSPWSQLSDTQRESIDMILHKIGRIMAGNPDHKDHWDDIAGYATLISNSLDGEQ